MRHFTISSVLALLLVLWITGCAPPSQRELEMRRYDLLEVSASNWERLPPEIRGTIEAYNDKQYWEAAAGFNKIRQEQQWRSLHHVARYYLAESLDRLGFYQPSMNVLGEILFNPQDNQLYFSAALTKLLALTKITKSERTIFRVLATINVDQFPAKFRNELTYMAGRMYYTESNKRENDDLLMKAIQQFDQVDPSSAFYAKAQYIKGVIQVINKDYAGAKRTFDIIADLPETFSDFGEYAKVKEMSKLSLGQLFYKAGFEATRQRYEILSAAIDYYDQVDRENNQWFEALFEKTWASMLTDRYNTALGTVHTLNSPFFAYQFVPEVTLIETITYYRLCKYPQVEDSINRFLDQFIPMEKAISNYMERNQVTKSSEIYHDLLRDYAHALNNRPSSLPLPVLTHLLNNDSVFLNAYINIQELERELKMLDGAPAAFIESALGKNVQRQLRLQASQAQKRAGRRAIEQMKVISISLSELIGNARAIRVELLDKQINFLQRLEAFGVTEDEYRADKAAIERDNYTAAVGDHELYWPFDGEYWKDELGYYLYSVDQECVE